jgi:CheY-like chemotaxis protein
MRVLAAEDNKTNQLVFRKMVKELNIELEFANNGLEAVEAYQNFGPDMIFMDISMPMMDGKQATAKIRELEVKNGKHIPVVALTAHAMAGDSESILAAGLDHYLTKPLRKALIHEKIRAYTPADVQSLDVMMPPAAPSAEAS